MNVITFDCPECKRPLSVPEAAASATGPCPHCGETITGPGLPEEPAPQDEDIVASLAEPDAREGAGIPLPEPVPEAEEMPPVSAEEPEDQSLAEPAPIDAPTDTPSAAEWEPAPSPEPAAARQPSQAKLFALFLFGGLLCMFIGYQFGVTAGRSAAKRDLAAIKGAPVPSNPQGKGTGGPSVTLPSTPPKTGDPDGGDPPKPPADPNRPVANAPSPARAALEAFLTAPDWASRSVYVLNQTGQLLVQMENFATERGDGPIAYTGISNIQQNQRKAVFLVKTKEHPTGFPVALVLANGRWLVDWPGFVDFHHDLFRSIPNDKKVVGNFRLLVQPMEETPTEGSYHRCTVSPPDQGKPVTVLVKADTPAHKDLQESFASLQAEDPEGYQKTLSAGGVPLILRISSTPLDGGQMLVVDQVVARGWEPLPMKSKRNSL